MKLSWKNMLPRTLFGRSLMILVTPVLLIQVITTFVFFDRHWDKMTDRLAYAVAGEIAAIAEQAENYDDPVRFERLAGYASRHLDLLISFEPDGMLAPPDMRHEQRSIIARALRPALTQQVRRPHRIEVEIGERWVEVGIQLETGVLHVSLPQRRLFSSTGYVFLLWMIGTSIILLAIAILFMRNQIRPIRRLSIAAERFGKGLDVPPSFKPEGAREIRQAARAFLDMHERIKRQIQQRTAMLAGVSHDLRTPLTRMKLQVSMMGNSADTEDLRKDIADMERMINAYLDFARGEGGEQAARTDLVEILQRIVTGARRQGVNIELDAATELFIHVRAVALERALSNIVSNARKYADHIWVSAMRDTDCIRVLVDDNGPGIPADQFEAVFRPFVRGEPSRNPATGGVGLGLPIAQDIITGHGGRIWLEESPHGGLRVVIELPV